MASRYMERQKRLLAWKPIKINLARKIDSTKPIMCSGFVPAGARLLSLAALRRSRAVDELAARSGVYFLWNDRDLVYIGSSEQIRLRVKNHLRKGRIQFNYATFLAIDFPWYLSVEAAYIVAYMPVSNSMHLWRRGGNF